MLHSTKNYFGQQLFNTVTKGITLELIQDYNGVLHHYLIYFWFIMTIILQKPLNQDLGQLT